MIFNERDFGHRKESVSTSPEAVEIQPEVVNESELDLEPTDPEQEPEQRQSERTREPPVRYGVDEYTAAANAEHVASAAYQIAEPQTMDEALGSDYSTEWKQAADAEYDSLMENQTWDLVELPSGRTPIGSKWVFKVKHKSGGTVERFKARLVAKGYAQQPGIDMTERFLLWSSFMDQSIRVLLTLAVQHDLLLHQMDVVTAFLNGILEETIYMQQPDGYIQQGKGRLVCKPNKSLYGLKQSPRCWNKVFTEFMKSIGFTQSSADPCIYVRDTSSLTIVADMWTISSLPIRQKRKCRK